MSLELHVCSLYKNAVFEIIVIFVRLVVIFVIL